MSAKVFFAGAAPVTPYERRVFFSGRIYGITDYRNGPPERPADFGDEAERRESLARLLGYFIGWVVDKFEAL
jgi:hypothetical protein